MIMCMIRNQIFYGKGTFQKSKSISDMESHGFLKTNKINGDHRGRDHMVVGFTTTFEII
jgi:hypothetical protein